MMLNDDSSAAMPADARGEWWSDLDDEVLRYLAVTRRATTTEIADKLRVSEASASSLLALLAVSGKLRISLVERETSRAISQAPQPDDAERLA